MMVRRIIVARKGGDEMKAVYLAQPGGPEKLIVGDRPDPEAGPGEVIVRNRGTALNHADLSLRAGRSPTGQLCPRSSGLDMAGEVASLGPGVNGWTAWVTGSWWRIASSAGPARPVRSGATSFLRATAEAGR